jgi:hypothetical protein
VPHAPPRIAAQIPGERAQKCSLSLGVSIPFSWLGSALLMREMEAIGVHAPRISSHRLDE